MTGNPDLLPVVGDSDDPEGPNEASAVIAIVLGVFAWGFFVGAILGVGDPFVNLLVAFVLGTGGLVLGIQARRQDAAVGAGLAAGSAVAYTALLATMLAAMVYATGFVLVLVILLFLFFLAVQPPAYSSSGGGCSGCSGPSGGEPCCCCCNDCGDSNATSGCCCGDGCCGCGDCGCGACDCGCGGCDCGGCGGCGCAALVIPGILTRASVGPLLVQPTLLARLAAAAKKGLPHHPDEPAYAQDVFLIRGARWCVGCFTTYPVFLVASLILAAASPLLTWSTMLAVGVAFAAAQTFSSIGWAKRRSMKIIVKSLLGSGLALIVFGVNAAPGMPIVKIAALASTLALALLSAVPRARRMRKASRGAGCACEARNGERVA